MVNEELKVVAALLKLSWWPKSGLLLTSFNEISWSVGYLLIRCVIASIMSSHVRLIGGDACWYQVGFLDGTSVILLPPHPWFTL